MPTIRLSSDQYDALNSAMNEARPIHDKVAGGDTGLSQTEMTTFTRAYDQWQSVLDSNK